VNTASTLQEKKSLSKGSLFIVTNARPPSHPAAFETDAPIECPQRERERELGSREEAVSFLLMSNTPSSAGGVA
jgi:hypothetical protein